MRFPALSGAMAALMLTLPIAATAGNGAQSTSTVSFERDLMPILKRRCAACHITGDEPGKMALVPGKAYESLVGVDAVGAKLKRVNPGQPEESYLLHKLLGTHVDVGGSGVRMPFHQAPLPLPQIDNFRIWIQQGANNN